MYYIAGGSGEEETQEIMEKQEGRESGGEPREPVSSKAGTTCETAAAFQIHSHKTRIT